MPDPEHVDAFDSRDLVDLCEPSLRLDLRDRERTGVGGRHRLQHAVRR